MFRFLTATPVTQALPPPRPSRPPRPFVGRNKVGLVGFSGKAFKIALPAPVDAPWLHQRVNSLPNRLSTGGTNITAALRLSLDVLDNAPPGAIKRIWLFSDGDANKDVLEIVQTVARAKISGVAVHTTAIGNDGDNDFNREMLKLIASGTPGGTFLRVQTLRELSAALVDQQRAPRSRHQATYTVYAVDLSPSMKEKMDGRTRIDVVREAIFHALNHEQKTFN